MTDEILQIAAIYENYEFSKYVIPAQQISASASKVNNLYNIAGELYCGNEKVDAVSLREALLDLSIFLQKTPESSLLIAHNARFDAPRIMEAIINNGLEKEFSIIHGFSDSLTFLKKEFPDRNGPGSFKLEHLAHDLLRIQEDEQFHDALFDIKILKKIIDRVGKTEKLFNSKKSFIESTEQTINARTFRCASAEFGDIKNIVSRDILKKMAVTNITLTHLNEVYKKGGEKDVIELLSTKCDDTNKPKVTNCKNKNVLDKIISFLKGYQSLKSN